MTWKQIDTLAVGADEPVDAFALLAIDGNVNAAHNARLRRWGMTWPADERPILGCHLQLAWILGAHPLTPGVTQITVTVQLAISDADVHLAIGVRSASGWTQSDEQTFAPGATTFEDLEADVSGHRGPCVVFLLLRSDTGANLGTTGAMTGRRFGNLWVDLSGHLGGLPFAAAERYVMQVTDPPATSMQLGDDPPPTPRTVMHNPLGAGTYPDRMYAWPPVTPDRNFESSGTYDLTIELLGRAELYGYDVRETEVTPLAPLTEALTAGNKPAFDAFGSLYQNGYDIATQRTRVYSSGPTLMRSSGSWAGAYDAQGDNYTHFGPIKWGYDDYKEPAFLAQPYRYFSSCTVGNTTDDQRRTGPDTATVDTPRTQYRAIAVLVFPYKYAPVEFDYRVKLELVNFNAVSMEWTANPVSAEVQATATTAFAAQYDVTDWQPPLLGFGINEVTTWHTLRGGWSIHELSQPSFAGIRLVEIAVDDVVPSPKRQARLLIRTETGRARNGALIAAGDWVGSLNNNVLFWCPSCCVYTQTGWQ